MANALYRQLQRLLTGGSLPLSQLSGRTMRALQPLVDAEALVVRRRGAGMVLKVVDQSAVAALSERLFPHGDSVPSAADGTVLPPRTQAVLTLRDAKRSRSASGEPVLLRAFVPATARCREAELNITELTRLAGAACLVLDGSPQWVLAGRVALVENLEFFLNFERLGVAVDVVLYAGGRLSGRVLHWLASKQMGHCRYLHCGDYDPVGLDEFRRLREILGQRVELYLPQNIDEIFRRYGKAALLKDSVALLAKLRSSPIAEISRIVQLMDDTGCGLEQEALLTG